MPYIKKVNSYAIKAISSLISSKWSKYTESKKVPIPSIKQYISKLPSINIKNLSWFKNIDDLTPFE